MNFKTKNRRISALEDILKLNTVQTRRFLLSSPDKQKRCFYTLVLLSRGEKACLKQICVSFFVDNKQAVPFFRTA